MKPDELKLSELKLKAAERATLRLRGIYQKYGYRKFRMGRFEEYSLYAANADFLKGDKVITFTDLDGRLLAMKPDVTLSIIKNSRATKDSSEKFYYIENVYREDKESNNFREVSQMGLEYIGNVDNYGVTEVLLLAARTLEEIDEEYILEISNMEYVTELLGSMNLSYDDYVHMLMLIRQKNIDGIRKVGAEIGLRKENIEILAQIPTLYGNVDETIKRARKLVMNTPMADALDQLRDVCAALKVMGASDKVQLDLSIVNDIDYYNGIIFRGFIKGLAVNVLSGGQYDRAMKIFGRRVGAVGFALYLDEISRLEREKEEFDIDALIIYEEGTKPDKVAEAVNAVMRQGLSVHADSCVPEGLRYGKKFTLEEAYALNEAAAGSGEKSDGKEGA